MSDDEAAYGLVMPFLPVKSKGGPHDDDAWVAGYEMGHLNAELAVGKADERPIREENGPQADLIAMRNGYVATVTEMQDGWSWLELKPASEESP